MNLRTAFRRTTRTQPIEVGEVSWGRDLGDALAASAESGKPVFALFQEVPGCAGCKQFGADVLSNPAIVDAVHEAFEPLLIHNNTGGPDAQVLALYGEPAWNYQVVRFLDSSGADLIPRKDRVWETGPLAIRMVKVLETAGRPVPAYLRLIEQEHSGRLETVNFAQACFWVGEMELGQIDGVVTTEAAFMGGHEVTTVRFDPNITNVATVARSALARRVANVVFANQAHLAELSAAGITAVAEDRRSYRVASRRDQKRQIAGVSGLGGLSEAQLTKLNAFARHDANRARDFLPPSLGHLLGRS